jgi:hypothetical protein
MVVGLDGVVWVFELCGIGWFVGWVGYGLFCDVRRVGGVIVELRDRFWWEG